MTAATPGDVAAISAIKFLNEAARYFENRQTNGEDRAFYANAQNAENCRTAATLIEQQAARIAELERERAGLGRAWFEQAANKIEEYNPSHWTRQTIHAGIVAVLRNFADSKDAP